MALAGCMCLVRMGNSPFLASEFNYSDQAGIGAVMLVAMSPAAWLSVASPALCAAINAGTLPKPTIKVET